jgi:hypothetical protein
VRSDFDFDGKLIGILEMKNTVYDPQADRKIRFNWIDSDELWATLRRI